MNTKYIVNNLSGQTINGNPIDPKYKVYTALLTQSGGDAGDDISSGLLVIGRTYQIGGSIAGDDFRNVGGPLIVNDNDFNGTYFVATGTTPTNYTNGTTLGFNTGAPVVTVLENTIGNIWFTYESAGRYRIIGDDVFPFYKTYVSPYGFASLTDLPDGIWSEVYGTNEIQIYSVNNADYVDGQLYNTPIEIRVYN